ncbi:hypothetical protein GUITHDRAFT_166387 [Guillardia theta CCMP2712]|uniref:Molybdate-anion transporter n=1 Tax=Guillardia theta (strain CCMP2712) TaxID=905079 RepID=L1ICA6_GUITC|nr:hypothetical protein GUITHDRAFT_166387 [Guillardia theta CCMP2712]EKX33727.1 hypothetical protein GUITHDRAFT_166387 [Guillardia theta CCMP2712]|eukprot:XP_005820707.1 hypothetical protein GUITHDRAFT_166387 [Guillardia theta CCMP2712]
MGFTVVLVVLCILCALIQWSQRKDQGQAGMPGGNVSGEFKRQQAAYMVAYCCAVTADWLQGPYVYALYEHYKFSKQEIGILFIAGFDFFHRDGWQCYHGHRVWVAPFDLAIVFLIASSITIAWKWQENKGDAGMGGMVLPSGKNDDRNKLKVALERMRRDPKIAVLGMIQSLFEGAMYIFVFMWTPKLEAFFKPLPHGRVFGCFMACMMLGSSSLKYLSSWQPPVRYLRELYIISGIMMAIPALGLQEGYSTVSCFFVFEWCCGLYFPSIGIVKSKYVPEEVRATIYNIFRIPLNVIVVAVLANLGSISDNVVFAMCSVFLFLAAVLQHSFIRMVGDHEGKAASLAAAENLTAELSHLTHYEPGEGKE